MSAKLLKALAENSCTVHNRSTSEVIVYWKDDHKKMQHLIVRPNTHVDLLQFASVAQLRRSPNLKELFNRGHLKISTGAPV